MRPGKRLLIPTSGPTATFPTGFPAAGVGHRTATFTVAVAPLGIGTHALTWSIESATDLAGSPVPLAQVGALVPIIAPSAEFTPAEATLRRADRIALVFKACQDDQPANCTRFDNVEISPMGDLDFDGKVSNTDYVKAARWAQGRLLPVLPVGGTPVNLAGEIGDPFLRLLSDVRPAVGQLLSPSRFDGWAPEFGKPGNTVGAPGYVPSPVKSEFDRDRFPFGDGLISNPDIVWIFRKAQANAIGKTLDPRVGGVAPVDF